MCMEWKGCFLRGDYCKKHSWTHKKLGKRKEAEMDENVDECLHILGIYSASFLFFRRPTSVSCFGVNIINTVGKCRKLA